MYDGAWKKTFRRTSVFYKIISDSAAETRTGCAEGHGTMGDLLDQNLYTHYIAKIYFSSNFYCVFGTFMEL